MERVTYCFVCGNEKWRPEREEELPTWAVEIFLGEEAFELRMGIK